MVPQRDKVLSTNLYQAVLDEHRTNHRSANPKRTIGISHLNRMHLPISISKALATVTACVLFALSVQASTNYIDFNSDPSLNGLLTVLHRPSSTGGTWYSSDGAPSDPFGTNGYFSITDASGGQRCTILFSDLDTNLVIKAFTFSMDIRVGLGSAQPADGFSINYARANDPVIVNNDGTGYASSPTGEADLEEEGTKTGLAVTFDSWFSGGSDVIGITVRVDNTIVTNVPMPVAHGGCTNLQSIQTGDTNAASPDDLCWTKLIVQLTTNSLLNLTYKGATFLTNFPTTFSPSAGRLILAGRTGDNSQDAHVDNISIVTIPTTGPAVGPATPSLNGFTMNIDDSGPATPNTNTLLVTLDGVTIINNGLNVSTNTATVTRSGTTTTIAYSQPALFPSLSTHVVHVTFSGSGFAGTIDEIRNFTVPSYPTLPVGLRTPSGSGSNPGFRMKAYQITTALNFVNGWQNQIPFDEQQLAGLISSNTVDLTSFTNNGYFFESNVVNYSLSGTAGSITPDALMPGLPGTLTLNDQVVYEMLAFVEFPSNGLYTMGVQSDDGFRVTVGDRTGPDVGLSVIAPANLAGRYFGGATATDYGQGFGAALPKTPIIARAVLCDPPWPTSTPNNAAALSNNIALLHRDPTGGVATHGIWAVQAGAVAVVLVDQDDQGASVAQGGAGRLPGIWGGSISGFNVPVVMMDYALGTNLFTYATTNTSSPVIMRLGDDSSMALGEFNGGRGGGTPTTFQINVPQAGVYPLRLVYENGGGDANVEWWTSTSTSTNLINDPSSAVKAYRTRVVSTGSAHLNPVTISGTNAIISWTGEGELEQALVVTGPWVKCPYQNNPATVPINKLLGTGSYFRIRQY
jgi:hypothetical protein